MVDESRKACRSWLRRMGALPVAVILSVAGLGSLADAAHADDAQVAGATFTVATDTTFAPFEYRENGQMTGIDMDLIHAIAKDQGFDVEIQSLGFNAALQAVSSGQADIAIAGASITDERKASYDFSDPYFESGIQMAVAQDDDSIAGYEDLAGKTVVAKTGAEGESYAKSIADEYGFTVTSVDQSATMYEMVKSGNAVAVFDDYPVLAYGISQNNGLKIVTPKVPNGEYGIIVAKGKNAALLKAINAGLANLKESGEYERILAKYLGDSGTATVAKSSFFDLARESFPALMIGLKNTLLITALSFVIALVLGVLFGLMRVSPNRIVSGIARVYVAVFRGTPILVWAFFFYFGVPQIISHNVNIWVAGALTLSLNSGAYLVEIVRGAIQSVPAGQMEGARSLGLSYGQAMSRVILPQAAKIAMPSVINQLVIMLKDSSLLLAIGFGELLYQAQQIYAANFRVTETLLMVGVIYFVAITLLTWIANIVDRKVNR